MRIESRCPTDGPATGAERGTDGDLAVTRSGASKQKVRHVGTGNQEHAGEHWRHAVLKGSRRHAKLFRGVIGIGLRQAMRHDIQIRRSLRHGHAWLEIAERPDIGVLKRGVLRNQTSIHRKRGVNVCPTRAEARRHDCHQCVKGAVEIECFPQNIRVAIELILQT